MGGKGRSLKQQSNSINNQSQDNNNDNDVDDNNVLFLLLPLIFVITMLTIKILFTSNSLKKAFRQITIYNSFSLNNT